MKIAISKSVYNNGKKIILSVFLVIVSQWAVALDYPEAGDFSQGSKVWSENCARCHNMRSPTDLRNGVTSLFHMRVRAGLTGQETRDILTFLKGVNTRPGSVVVGDDVLISEGRRDWTPAIGKKIYENNCIACHSADGKGSLPGVPDFTDKNGRLIKAENVLLSNMINGFQSSGSLMPMPPRGGNNQLSDVDLNAALKYIKTTFSE